VDAGAASLRRRPDIDPRRVGLVGWSLGGGLAIAVAEQADARAPRGVPKPYAVVVAYSAGAFGPTLADAGSLPPTLVLSGGARDAMPVADSIALRDALRAAHVPSALYVYPDGSHDWPGAQYWAGLSHTLAFLRRYFR
jgi:dienelactone hydrolase